MSGGEEQTVGDLVCSIRGTPKPDWNPTAQTRKVGQCEPLEVQQTRRPTEQCMAEYAAMPEEPEEPEEPVEEEVAETPDVNFDLEVMGSAGSKLAVGAAFAVLLA
jgi:hypothetical protein